MKTRVRLCAALLVAWPVLSGAAEKKDPCADAADTIAINACLKRQLDEQDRQLNVAYQKLLRELAKASEGAAKGESPRELLVASQRRWLEFRDADCKAMRQLFAGGSGSTATHLTCLRDRTEQRLRQLDPKDWTGG